MSTRCNVCLASGNQHIAHTHTTRGPSNPVTEHIIKCGGWSLVKPLGGTTNCPVLQANVCTNPLCFNGMDGLVRFPNYGHTTKYCPCAWPVPQQLPNTQPIVEDEMCVEEMDWEKFQDDDRFYGAHDEFTDLMNEWVETVELEEQNVLHQYARSRVRERREIWDTPWSHWYDES